MVDDWLRVGHPAQAIRLASRLSAAAYDSQHVLATRPSYRKQIGHQLSRTRPGPVRLCTINLVTCPRFPSRISGN